MTLMDLFEYIGLPAHLGLLFLFGLVLLIILFVKMARNAPSKHQAPNANESAVSGAQTGNMGGVIAAISAAVSEYQKNET